VLRKAFLHTFYPLVSLSSLVEDNVYDLVVFTDVLRRYGHELVNDLAEKVNIASGITSYP
jgi:hypothetical protein